MREALYKTDLPIRDAHPILSSCNDKMTMTTLVSNLLNCVTQVFHVLLLSVSLEACFRGAVNGLQSLCTIILPFLQSHKTAHLGPLSREREFPEGE